MNKVDTMDKVDTIVDVLCDFRMELNSIIQRMVISYQGFDE